MQDATMEDSARRDCSVSNAADGSLKDTAAVVLSATTCANTVATAPNSWRVTVRSYAISALLASSNAAPLMVMIMATIFFGMERLRKFIVPRPRPGNIGQLE